MKETISTIQVPDGIKILNYSVDGPKLSGDVAKIQRVFVNLITNAIEIMSEGGTLEIRSIRTNGNVEFSFADTGSGIPEEVMTKPFTPSFTTKAQGMGKYAP